jgi:predicted molibdopterin-dependent oxidoreductase YjgC
MPPMKLRRGQQQMTADPKDGLGLPRLTTPYVRDNGELRPATWDEALDRAAVGFGRAREAIEHGNRNAFGLFSCSKATNEVNYLAQKWARVVMGSNNIDSCNRT